MLYRVRKPTIFFTYAYFVNGNTKLMSQINLMLHYVCASTAYKQQKMSHFGHWKVWKIFWCGFWSRDIIESFFVKQNQGTAVHVTHVPHSRNHTRFSKKVIRRTLHIGTIGTKTAVVKCLWKTNKMLRKSYQNWKELLYII